MAKFIKISDDPTCRFVRESSIEYMVVQDIGDGTWQVAVYGASGNLSEGVGGLFASLEDACDFAEDFAKGLA